MTLLCVQPALAQDTQSIPFVGCKSDGQLGPMEAPAGSSVALAIAPNVAARLAWYQSEQGSAVLAPRGWNCFATYGSGGDALFVSPEELNGARFFSQKARPFTGPVIEFVRRAGDTSGRFDVAQIMAIAFPEWKSHVEELMRESDQPASRYHFGAYPTDKLTYRSKTVVEYRTPALKQGLGTQSRLAPNAEPIDGVAILSGETPDLWQLISRLPPAMRDLAPVIVRDVERRAAESK